MPFDNLTERLKIVAVSSLSLCRGNWGNNGLKKEEAIDPKIGWRPTFFLKPSKYLIVAVEVDDAIYPDSLRGAADDIVNHDFPICAYQACSLDVYQSDPQMKRVNALRNRGFGLITVSTEGEAIVRDFAQPLAQFISQEKLDGLLKALSPKLKVKFKAAHTTYMANVGQGLQEAGQIIEAIVLSIAEHAQSATIVGSGTINKSTAEMIDRLYATQAFEPHRAALGGTRNFVKNYRNIASHPPKDPKQAAEKIRKCKEGFVAAIQLASQLKEVAERLGYRIKIA